MVVVGPERAVRRTVSSSARTRPAAARRRRWSPGSRGAGRGGRDGQHPPGRRPGGGGGRTGPAGRPRRDGSRGRPRGRRTGLPAPARRDRHRGATRPRGGRTGLGAGASVRRLLASLDPPPARVVLDPRALLDVDTPADLDPDRGGSDRVVAVRTSPFSGRAGSGGGLRHFLGHRGALRRGRAVPAGALRQREHEQQGDDAKAALTAIASPAAVVKPDATVSGPVITSEPKNTLPMTAMPIAEPMRCIVEMTPLAAPASAGRRSRR